MNLVTCIAETVSESFQNIDGETREHHHVYIIKIWVFPQCPDKGADPWSLRVKMGPTQKCTLLNKWSKSLHKWRSSWWTNAHQIHISPLSFMRSVKNKTLLTKKCTTHHQIHSSNRFHPWISNSWWESTKERDPHLFTTVDQTKAIKCFDIMGKVVVTWERNVGKLTKRWRQWELGSRSW